MLYNGSHCIVNENQLILVNVYNSLVYTVYTLHIYLVPICSSCILSDAAFIAQLRSISSSSPTIAISFILSHYRLSVTAHAFFALGHYLHKHITRICMERLFFAQLNVALPLLIMAILLDHSFVVFS